MPKIDAPKPWGDFTKVCWVCGKTFWPSQVRSTRCSNCAGKQVNKKLLGTKGYEIWIQGKMTIHAVSRENAVAKGNLIVRNCHVPCVTEWEMIQPKESKKHGRA